MVTKQISVEQEIAYKLMCLHNVKHRWLGDCWKVVHSSRKMHMNMATEVCHRFKRRLTGNSVVYHLRGATLIDKGLIGKVWVSLTTDFESAFYAI